MICSLIINTNFQPKISTRSPQAPNCSNHNQLGNLHESKNVKTGTMRSYYMPKLVVFRRCHIYTNGICTEDAASFLTDDFSYTCRKNAHIALKICTSGGTDAPNERKCASKNVLKVRRPSTSSWSPGGETPVSR